MCACIRVNEFSYYLTSANQSIFIEFIYLSSRNCVCVYMTVHMCMYSYREMYRIMKGNESEGLKLTCTRLHLSDSLHVGC